MTIDQLITVLTSAGAPGILALWLWAERKERLRLQRVVESFLPLIAGTHRAISSVTRVVASRAGEDSDADA